MGEEQPDFRGHGGREGDVALRTLGGMRLQCLQISEAAREKRRAAPIFGLWGSRGSHGRKEGGNKPDYQNYSAHMTVSRKTRWNFY